MSSSELELMVAASSELARSTQTEEARSVICEAFASVSGAEVVVLLEPDEPGTSLLVTASRGIEADEVALPLSESSGAALSLRTNAPRFVADAATEPGGAGAFLRSAGISSVAWQPIARGRSIRAVAGVGWREPIAIPGERILRLLAFVAVESAVALDRGTAVARLVGMARSDPLTGLENRRAWEYELRRELSRAAREQTPLSVAMIDLDGFKTLNDERGHAEGDRLLAHLGERWRVVVRATDILARHGGDEFALALPRCGLERAVATVNRLRDAAGQWGTFCAGVTVWDGAEEGQRLIARADDLLYRAKHAGPGTILSG